MTVLPCVRVERYMMGRAFYYTPIVFSCFQRDEKQRKREESKDKEAKVQDCIKR